MPAEEPRQGASRSSQRVEQAANSVAPSQTHPFEAGSLRPAPCSEDDWPRLERLKVEKPKVQQEAPWRGVYRAMPKLVNGSTIPAPLRHSSAEPFQACQSRCTRNRASTRAGFAGGMSSRSMVAAVIVAAALAGVRSAARPRHGSCRGRCRHRSHPARGRGAGQLAEPRAHLRRAALQPADRHQRPRTSASSASPGRSSSTPTAGRKRRRWWSTA